MSSIARWDQITKSTILAFRLFFAQNYDFFFLKNNIYLLNFNFYWNSYKNVYHIGFITIQNDTNQLPYYFNKTVEFFLNINNWNFNKIGQIAEILMKQLVEFKPNSVAYFKMIFN